MKRNILITIVITSSIIIFSPKIVSAKVLDEINSCTTTQVKENKEITCGKTDLNSNKKLSNIEIKNNLEVENNEKNLRIEEEENSKRLNEKLENKKENSIKKDLNKSKIKIEESIAKHNIEIKKNKIDNAKEIIDTRNKYEKLKLEKEKAKNESEKLEKKIESEKLTKIEEKKEKERKAIEEEKRANAAIHSNTQRKLYNYLKSEKNCESTFKEAVRLHGGDTSNNCVYFTSEALRRVGVKIPKNICYTTKLESELIYRGWKKSTNFSDLQRGDICFAGIDHAFTFMGWADKDKMIANIADNQYKKFKKHLHERPLYEDDEKEISKTTHYYKL